MEAVDQFIRPLGKLRATVSPLRYPGGKRKLAPLIAGLVTAAGGPASLLVEPFAGGAAVSLSLLEAGLADEIGLADADPIVASFWQVVFSDEADKLADMTLSARFTLEDWKAQKAMVPRTPLEAAWKCLYLNRTSFSGSLMDYAGPMGGKAQAGPDRIGSRFNREAIACRILELKVLRDRVRFVRNACWQETLKEVDASRPGGLVFWYLDPPYVAKARRLYQHSFRLKDHEALARAINKLPGSFALSYDDHPEVERLYGDHPGFTRIPGRYNVRVDGGQRQVFEVIVSDVIACMKPEAIAA